MKLSISPGVLNKLKEKHGVSKLQVIECFANRTVPFLTDNRLDHQTDPPTRWFIAETDMGVKLKVVYIRTDTDFVVKTAYPPNAEEIAIYAALGYVCFS